MGKKGVIDRIEGEWVVVELEDGDFVDLPATNLPIDAVEGSVVFIDKWEKVTLLTDETQIKRREIESLIEKLFEEE